MKKISRLIWNLISGIFVLFLSLWLSGPGIAEKDIPTYRWYFMLFFAMWVVGFVIQFKTHLRALGILITVIPVVYFLFRFLSL